MLGITALVRDASKWQFRHIVALFAGLGLFAPAGLFLINYCCGPESDWWLVFWPTAYTLLGDSFEPPTPVEIGERWAFAIGLNVVLYVLVGTLVWSVIAVVRRLRAN